jgi:hypothetical protein
MINILCLKTRLNFHLKQVESSNNMRLAFLVFNSTRYPNNKYGNYDALFSKRKINTIFFKSLLNVPEYFLRKIARSVGIDNRFLTTIVRCNY